MRGGIDRGNWSPFLGTDYLNDDAEGFAGIPIDFSANLLGVKRVLAVMHEDPDQRRLPQNYSSTACPTGRNPLSANGSCANFMW
jgi:hypothetical protein